MLGISSSLSIYSFFFVCGGRVVTVCKSTEIQETATLATTTTKSVIVHYFHWCSHIRRCEVVICFVHRYIFIFIFSSIYLRCIFHPFRLLYFVVIVAAAAVQFIEIQFFISFRVFCDASYNLFDMMINHWITVLVKFTRFFLAFLYILF